MDGCTGKRAGDVCTLDGGAGTCVPPDACSDSVCLACELARPIAPAPSAVGGCSVGGGLALALALAVALRRNA